MFKKVSTFFVMLALLLSFMTTSAQGPILQVPDSDLQAITGSKTATQVYIVQLSGDPVVAYEGGLSGLPPTAPGPGQKANPNSQNVQRYVAHLIQKHNQVLASVGAPGLNKIYDYTFSLDGFAALLTPAQAEALKQHPDVVQVWVDELRQPTTENSPDFLGLTAEGGLWDQGVSGEDVIIGVIDTGIWPEHPSFSDQDDLADRPGDSGKRQRVYGPPPAYWHGTCQAGELWSQDDCNNKLIGARYFLTGYGHQGIITDDYLSARDRDGHGTHTASTAGGNRYVPATVLGVDRGEISGMAYRARIAAYKACWNGEGCALSDLAMAIDAAVADGVDVINYSIGSGTTYMLFPDTIAFLFAARAGVFASVSAGNAGPGASTVGAPAVAPWVTTVGASTQDRTFEGSVRLGNNEQYFGSTITGGTDVLPLVDSEDAGSVLCIPGELDPSVVSGKIVLCKRGTIARVAKSQAVQIAGGLGMVLYNASDTESLNTDNHYVPTVHINNTNGVAVKAYIDSAGAAATAQIYGGERVSVPAPWMADFSSRGPNGGAPDILKPDVTAPGVNILAGNTPTAFLGYPGQLFQSIGGTSMSSPHVAGVGALLVQAHRNWTPGMIKSALMTTAYQSVMKEDGLTQADPFDMGAGHIQPNTAADPGLVYGTAYRDYLAFLCGSFPGLVGQSTCTTLTGLGYSLDPSGLNLASITIAELAGIQTVTRTVTNVGPSATYHVIVEAPAGVDVVVTPDVLTLAAGASAAYQVTFTTNTSAVIDEWTFGSLTWSHGPHSVRSPLSIRPIALAAPAEVEGTGVNGSLTYDVTFGYTGDFSAQAHGLIPAVAEAGNVVDDPANDINTALATGVGITLHNVTILTDTEYVRFSLFDEYTDGADDLDLYVFGPASQGDPFAGGSGSPTSLEEVNLVNPDPGEYTVIVHGWQTDGPDANYTLFTWALMAGPTGNMTVTAPSTATIGEQAEITVDWAGLTAGSKYLGAVSHHSSASPTGFWDNQLGFTIVRVDTD